MPLSNRSGHGPGLLTPDPAQLLIETLSKQNDGLVYFLFLFLFGESKPKMMCVCIPNTCLLYCQNLWSKFHFPNCFPLNNCVFVCLCMSLTRSLYAVIIVEQFHMDPADILSLHMNCMIFPLNSTCTSVGEKFLFNVEHLHINLTSVSILPLPLDFIIIIIIIFRLLMFFLPFSHIFHT